MARGRYRRQRRWRRLAALGLVVTAGASALWFRSLTGHFPWATSRDNGNQDCGLMLTAGTISADDEAVMTPAMPTTPTSRPAPQTPAASTSRPVVPDVPTTLPAYDRPTHADPVQAAADFKTGLDDLAKGNIIAAREMLGRAYQAGLPSTDTEQACDKLADVVKLTLFSPRLFKGDPLCEFVIVQPGDTLAKIAARHTLSEDSLAFINNIKDKNIVRLGQRMKVMRGPWHAVVSKSRHVMDLYLQDKYVRSFRVGLGQEGSTPAGLWRVANRQADPGWTDPTTGHRWHPSDPGNPIGEYWIGLEGLDGDALGQNGYGVHGTIEPDSIGKDVSMGCIRMAPDDIALLYKLVLPGQSCIAVIK